MKRLLLLMALLMYSVAVMADGSVICADRTAANVEEEVQADPNASNAGDSETSNSDTIGDGGSDGGDGDE